MAVNFILVRMFFIILLYQMKSTEETDERILIGRLLPFKHVNEIQLQSGDVLGSVAKEGPRGDQTLELLDILDGFQSCTGGAVAGTQTRQAWHNVVDGAVECYKQTPVNLS